MEPFPLPAPLNRLRLRRVGIDTYQEPVLYMHRDCAVCHSEGFKAQSRVEMALDGRNIVSNAHEARRTAPLLASGVVLHVLPAGAVFDLDQRVLVQSDATVDLRANADLEVANRDLRRLARDIASGDVSPSVFRRRRARQRTEGDTA